MKGIVRKSLSEITIEQAHGGSGSRQVLVSAQESTSPYFEAMTKGFLEPGKVFDWHQHIDTDEYIIVTKGEGIFFTRDDSFECKEGDVIIVSANTEHKIEAKGEITNEYFFVRVKSK